MTYNYEGYLINDPIQFAKYLAHKLGKHASAVRINKSMYLLYKIYTSTLGHLEEHFNSDVPSDFNHVTLPDKLFPANFQAWVYGPVHIDVYHYMKEHKSEFENNDEPVQLFNNITELQQDVLDYLDIRIEEINAIHAYGLVDITRSHKDFKRAFENGKVTPIPEQWIVEDAMTHESD